MSLGLLEIIFPIILVLGALIFPVMVLVMFYLLYSKLKNIEDLLKRREH